MGWLWTFWEIGVNCIENALIILLLTRQLGYSEEKRRFIPLCFIGLVTAESLCNFNNVPEMPTMLIFLSCQVAVSVLAFQGSLPKRLIWGGAGIIIAQCSTMITVNLFSFFGNVNLMDSIVQTQTRFEMMICYILIFALLFFVLVHINPKGKIFLKWPLRITVIGIFVIGIMAIQIIINVYFRMTEINDGAYLSYIDGDLIIISVIIIGTFLGMLFLFEYVGSLAQKNLDALTELQQTKSENAQLKHVSDTYQALRAWKHDYQNHLDLLQTYLDQNKYIEMGKYLSEIRNESGPFMHLYYTGHNLIDAVLSNKLFIAHSKGIDINCNIFLPEKLNIPDPQLCSILSNLLDNAIEAQESIASPFINVIIHQERGMLYIRIENNSSGKYLFENDQLISVKNSADQDHGIGLKQVKKIVEILRGIINIEPQSDKFKVQILIPMDIEREDIA